MGKGGKWCLQLRARTMPLSLLTRRCYRRDIGADFNRARPFFVRFVDFERMAGSGRDTDDRLRVWRGRDDSVDAFEGEDVAPVQFRVRVPTCWLESRTTTRYAPFFDMEVFVLIPVPCIFRISDLLNPCRVTFQSRKSTPDHDPISHHSSLSHTMVRRRQVIPPLGHFPQRGRRVCGLDLEHAFALGRREDPASRSDASVLLQDFEPDCPGAFDVEGHGFGGDFVSFGIWLVSWRGGRVGGGHGGVFVI